MADVDIDASVTTSWYKLTDTAQTVTGTAVTAGQSFAIFLPETPLRSFLIVEYVSGSPVVTVESQRKVEPGEGLDDDTITVTSGQHRMFLLGRPWLSPNNVVEGSVASGNVNLTLAYIF